MFIKPAQLCPRPISPRSFRLGVAHAHGSGRSWVMYELGQSMNAWASAVLAGGLHFAQGRARTLLMGVLMCGSCQMAPGIPPCAAVAPQLPLASRTSPKSLVSCNLGRRERARRAQRHPVRDLGPELTVHALAHVTHVRDPSPPNHPVCRQLFHARFMVPCRFQYGVSSQPEPCWPNRTSARILDSPLIFTA